MRPPRRSRRFAERFDFEPVVVVEVAATQDCPEARGQVRGYEQRSPDLALTHVDALVGTRARECPLVLSDDDMPERQGGGSSAHQRQVHQDPREVGPLRLDDAPDDPNAGAPESRQHQQESEGRGRCRPDVSQGAEDTVHT